METVTLDEGDYIAAMERCASKNIVSGVIYDALQLQAALKAGADVLYTENRNDFDRLRSNNEIEIKSLP